jgi:hypothetical protein
VHSLVNQYLQTDPSGKYFLQRKPDAGEDRKDKRVAMGDRAAAALQRLASSTWTCSRGHVNPDYFRPALTKCKHRVIYAGFLFIECGLDRAAPSLQDGRHISDQDEATLRLAQEVREKAAKDLSEMSLPPDNFSLPPDPTPATYVSS